MKITSSSSKSYTLHNKKGGWLYIKRGEIISEKSKSAIKNEGWIELLDKLNTTIKGTVTGVTPGVNTPKAV